MMSDSKTAAVRLAAGWAAMLALLAAFAGCGSDRDAGGQASRGDSRGASAAATVTDAGRDERAARLREVDSWHYQLTFDDGGDGYRRLAGSSYQMVVLEPVVTESGSTDFDISAVVQNLHGASRPKIVLAYIDIGQAEDWRTYWQPGWEVGDPDWIVGTDPDGWEGNYPVAFWRDEWKEIWLRDGGYLDRLIDAGFDGVYLDWVEAYSDGSVAAAAEGDGVHAAGEMVRWVGEIAAHGRSRDEGFIVIAQNAAELAGDEGYTAAVDAIAQEHVWFDGGAGNEPPGDCPLPRAVDDVGSAAYIAGLPAPCLEIYEEFPQGSLHTSSEEYLASLKAAADEGLVIFTVDYAVKPENVAWVFRESRANGFKPFAGERGLGAYAEPRA